MNFKDLKLKWQDDDETRIVTKRKSKFKALFAFLKFGIFLSMKLPEGTEQVSSNTEQFEVHQVSQGKMTSLLCWRVYKQVRGKSL